MEGLLPPYTPEERSRELRMSSKALRYRARRAYAQSRRLLDVCKAILRASESMRTAQTTLQPAKQAPFVIRYPEVGS